jgi:hypothetical protein
MRGGAGLITEEERCRKAEEIIQIRELKEPPMQPLPWFIALKNRPTRQRRAGSDGKLDEPLRRTADGARLGSRP